MTAIDINYQDAATVQHSVVDFEDSTRSMAIHVTEEGVILDLYEVDEDGNDMLTASVGMMYNEWADWMEGK